MATAPSEVTVYEQVEQSEIVQQLDARSSALAELLPSEEAVARFRRGIVIAILRNPELLECTPASMVLSVFEAAQMGLEPVREAHFVPRRINVGSKDRPRYEKQAQMVPDYRGIIRLITKPGSEIASIEARVVREGDEFEYELGSDAWVKHKPSMAPDRSTKAGTHYYTVARLRAGGPPLVDVEDRAGIERIKSRAHPSGFSPWSSDFDEMGKKTMVKRHGKVLPVPQEVRTILAREDEIAGEIESGDAPAALPAGPTKVKRLASRLARPSDGPGADEEATQLPESAPIEDAAAGPAEAAASEESEGLTQAQLAEQLTAINVTPAGALAKAKELWPEWVPTDGPLTPVQRAELLASLTAEKASAAL